MKFILERDFSDKIDTLCKKCGELQSECICHKNREILPRNAHKIKLKVQRIKDKWVTSFYPFYIDDEKGILKMLKKRLGCGGNVDFRHGYTTINLQGDVAQKAKVELQRLGFKMD